DCSPLRPERLAGVDVLVIRELTGGLYFGQPRLREEAGGRRRAGDTPQYSGHEIARGLAPAFEPPRGRPRPVTPVRQAHLLQSSRLWRQVAGEVAFRYPDVKLDHQLVDSAAMRLVTAPASFDVVVTENMFGDILTDEAAVLAGSLGLLPSASLGDGTRGVYEPIHGSAPDIAGKGIANPLGTILSAAMLLRHSLGLEVEAIALQQAVEKAVKKGRKAADLGGTLSTSAMGGAVRAEIAP